MTMLHRSAPQERCVTYFFFPCSISIRVIK
jgi:hypothetical protein